MKRDDFCTILGLTQREIALILGITRSQWSMYVLGRRDLPLPAMQTLAKLLQHMKTPHKAKSAAQLEQQQIMERAQLQKKLDENTYQLHKLAKKTIADQEKQTAAAKRVHLSDFYAAQKGNRMADTHFRFLSSKASNAAKTDHFATALENELRRKNLNCEREFLEAKLKAYSK